MDASVELLRAVEQELRNAGLSSESRVISFDSINSEQLQANDDVCWYAIHTKRVDWRRRKKWLSIMTEQSMSAKGNFGQDMLSPLQVPAAYVHVANRIRQSILLGKALPGDRLPPERQLAESLGVSRVTVREALRVLQGEGLISTSRGNAGGTFIKDLESSREERILKLVNAKSELAHIHELRLALEPMAAGLAAKRASSDVLQHLEVVQASLYSSTGVATFRQADSAFHLGVAAASGNPCILAAVEDARARLFTALDVSDFRVHQETSGRAHAEILAALREGDTASASTAMAEHLEQAWNEITEIVEDYERQVRVPAS